MIVENILPIVLKRIDDKPNVAEAALKVGQDFVSKLSIQSFPNIIEVLFQEMREESKWKAKVGSLTLLGEFITRLDMYDRDLLSASLPELVDAITKILYDTKPEVAELAESVLRKAMKGITNRDLEPFVEDLIKAAYNNAKSSLKSKTTEEISKNAGNFGIPGFKWPL